MDGNNPNYTGQKGRAAYERKLTHTNDEGVLHVSSKEGGKDVQIAKENKKGLAHLLRHELSRKKFSAGSIQPTRLQMLTADSCFFASDNETFVIHMDLNEDPTEIVNEGSEGAHVSVPMKFNKVQTTSTMLHKNHSEIQSVSTQFSTSTQPNSSGYLAASIDASGGIYLYNESSKGKSSSVSNAIGEKGEVLKKRRINPDVQYNLDDPQVELLCSKTSPEFSWAGLSFNPHNLSALASVHAFSKKLRLYDCSTKTCLNDINTFKYPTNLSFMDPNTCVLTEFNQVSVWDFRSNTCVSRESPNYSSCFYGLAISTDGHTVSIGGQDKIVYSYDNRTWKLKNRWKCPLKYDVISLKLSPTNPSLIYAIGLDNEVMCGNFNDTSINNRKNKKPQNASNSGGSTICFQSILQQNHRLGFRGDARWVGVDVTKFNDQNDVVVGMCESGSLYATTGAQLMVV